MIYLWEISDEYPENFIGEYDVDNSPDRFIFKQGKILTETINKPIVKYFAYIEDLKKFDDIVSNTMVPIVSDRVGKLLLDLAQDDIQLIDVTIETLNGVLEGYYLLNITNQVTGIDKAKSEYSFIPGTDKIMSFRSLYYKEDCLGLHKLARDSEYPSHILVSEEIYLAFETLQVKGLALSKPEDIHW